MCRTRKNEARTPQEHIVDSITHHNDERPTIKYILRWYDYAPADKIIEPPNNSPESLQYNWRWIWKKANDKNLQPRKREKVETIGPPMMITSSIQSIQKNAQL